MFTSIVFLHNRPYGSFLAQFVCGMNTMTIAEKRRSFAPLWIAGISVICVWVVFIAIAYVFAARVAVPRLLNHTFGGGKSVIKGELVDTYCWGTQKTAGKDHAFCAINCAKRGIPVAVVDQTTHRAFVLVPARNQISLPPELIEAMGQQVAIHGEVFERGGNEFATVRSWHRLR
jgi:hypothetical protein